jgi:hypothetical protein
MCKTSYAMKSRYYFLFHTLSGLWIKVRLKYKNKMILIKYSRPNFGSRPIGWEPLVYTMAEVIKTFRMISFKLFINSLSSINFNTKTVTKRGWKHTKTFQVLKFKWAWKSCNCMQALFCLYITNQLKLVITADPANL